MSEQNEPPFGRRSWAVPRHPVSTAIGLGVLFFALLLGALFAGLRYGQGTRHEELAVKKPEKPPEQKHEVPWIQRVRGEDIGVSVEIRGRLGKPLGELMTIQGEWSWPEPMDEKNPHATFLVTVVNGEALEKPVAFHSWFVSAIDYDPDKPRRCRRRARCGSCEASKQEIITAFRALHEAGLQAMPEAVEPLTKK